MAVKEGFVPHFPIFPRPMIDGKGHRSSRVVCIANGPSSFREILPLYSRRWRTTEFVCNDSAHSTQRSSFSNCNISRLPELAFDRLQLSDQEICDEQMRVFGRFVARGAALDEEYWTAAWLRAEAHWESLSYMRHVESYKRKYAEQEFYALKDRCCGRDGNLSKCFCMVAVKKEEPNVRRTVLNSVVGTLDLNIRPFYRGETYPGELKKLSTSQTSHEAYDTRKYAYIANVCVSKYARRRGIASNMLHLATDIAISAGMKQLFVHVNVDNKPAQKLYNKIGFEIVEAAPPSKDQRFLMFMEL